MRQGNTAGLCVAGCCGSRLVDSRGTRCEFGKQAQTGYSETLTALPAGEFTRAEVTFEEGELTGGNYPKFHLRQFGSVY